MLIELGCKIVGTASRLSEAMAAAREVECDAAVLDVNVNGENIAPVAAVLADRGTPMIFSTGYGRSGIDSRFRDRPVLQKPYRIEEFAESLRQALRSAGEGRE